MTIDVDDSDGDSKCDDDDGDDDDDDDDDNRENNDNDDDDDWQNSCRSSLVQVGRETNVGMPKSVAEGNSIATPPNRHQIRCELGQYFFYTQSSFFGSQNFAFFCTLDFSIF